MKLLTGPDTHFYILVPPAAQKNVPSLLLLDPAQVIFLSQANNYSDNAVDQFPIPQSQVVRAHLPSNGKD